MKDSLGLVDEISRSVRVWVALERLADGVQTYMVDSSSSKVTLVCLLMGDFMHTLHSLRCLPLSSRGCGGLAMQF